MKDLIILNMIDIAKWTIVLLIAGVIFYNVYPQPPKYTFVAGTHWIYKCNTQDGCCDKARENSKW